MKHFQYDIVTKTGRSKLPERQEPYWHSLGEGIALGYRQKSGGSWVARWRDKGGKVRFESLGSRPDFNAASAAAAEIVTKMASSPRRTPVRGSVRDALCAYLRHMRSIGRRDTAIEAGGRFRLTVPRADSADWDEPPPAVLIRFGSMKLKDVTREDVEAWRDALKKGRENRSVGRQFRAVRAALNYAVDHAGHSGNTKAWKLPMLVDDAEANSPVFLTEGQRDRIIAAAPPTLAALLTGYSETGARPSELAKATVGDFDAKGGTVTLRHRKGRGGKIKSRAVQLSDTGIEFFKSQVSRKLPKAPLISNANGGHWTDQEWCGGIEKTIKAVNKAAKKPAERIPDGTSAYSFRHSRISELLQVFGVDPLTTAAQTGTSITMIEKFYFKFISSSMRDKLNMVKDKAVK